jgi:hypothetical protein
VCLDTLDIIGYTLDKVYASANSFQKEGFMMIAAQKLFTGSFLITGCLAMAATMAWPLQPAFGEGGARRDVVRQSGEHARAEAAAPSSLSRNATILDRNGNELRKGTNGWTCIPDNPGKAGTGPLCMNQSWLHFREALKHQQPPADSQVGIAYMLQGGISASNGDPHSLGPHIGDDWVDGMGALIMIAVPDPAILKDLPTSSKNGGPWVMWADTPYAHLMLPIQSFPSQ